MFNLSGKSALVTGATGGIGEAIARLTDEIESRKVRQAVKGTFNAAAVDSDATGNEY